ncbi:acyltransferase [Nocardioides oleivorans]|uniref:Acyltransferase n=1 Tax=Nocardioides oleivorans TaxID=273676 RepID=A0A4Q2S187_9ACTN|nr:acyltransferase [Nocardioides oleivorans]RYB95248.1 acyltransferase [Nocardioides oleivorans]
MPGVSDRFRSSGVILGDRLGDRDNNFDVLRLLAAWAVLVSHSYALVGLREPLHQLDTSLGHVGVLIFFAVSGLLIRRSWELDPSPRDFWIKRALRLLPGLAVVALATAFVLGPLVTRVSLGTYFTSPETWIYPFRLVLLVPFGADLPGVFSDSIYGASVNGPLWSLPVEVFAYLLLFLMGVTGVLRSRAAVTALAVAGLAWAAWWVTVTSPSLGAVSVLAAFALAAATYGWRDRVVLSHPVAVAALVVCALAGLGPESLSVVVWTVGAVYLSFWFAYALPPVGRVLTRFGDASYGLYIWAFPVQQTIVQVLGDDIHPWLLVAVATPIVWVLAIASWRLVERPALARKPRPTRVAA